MRQRLTAEQRANMQRGIDAWNADPPAKWIVVTVWTDGDVTVVGWPTRKKARMIARNRRSDGRKEGARFAFVVRGAGR